METNLTYSRLLGTRQIGVCGGVLMILYFSATGNSKYVAERIAANTNDHAVSIEKNLIIK